MDKQQLRLVAVCSQTPDCPVDHVLLHGLTEKQTSQITSHAPSLPLPEDSFEEVTSRSKDDGLETKGIPAAGSKPRPKTAASKLKKAAEAPKRFKSAFIFYSTEKHKEIRAQLGEKGLTEKTANISKLVSEAWRGLSLDDREKWEIMARNDRARYEVEKTMFKGPWHVPKGRKQKHADAPKRPMSAFLAFANSRRGTVKQGMPGSSNGDVSRALAAMWKDAPDEVRQGYIDEEREKRKRYIAAMAEWKQKDEEEKRFERQQREERATRLADDMESKIGGNLHQFHGLADESHEDSIAAHREMTAIAPSHYSSGVFPSHNSHGLRGTDFSGGYTGHNLNAVHADRQRLTHLDESKVGPTAGDLQQPLAALLAHPCAYIDQGTTMLSSRSYFNPYADARHDVDNFQSTYRYPSSTSTAFTNSRLDPRTDPYAYRYDLAGYPNSFATQYETSGGDPFSYQFQPMYQHQSQQPPFAGYDAERHFSDADEVNDSAFAPEQDSREQNNAFGENGKPRSR